MVIIPAFQAGDMGPNPVSLITPIQIYFFNIFDTSTSMLTLSKYMECSIVRVFPIQCYFERRILSYSRTQIRTKEYY